MATFSEIKIKFTADLTAGAQLRFNYTNSGGTFAAAMNSNLLWDWVSARTANYQVTVGTPTATAGERAAINFMAALIIDQPGGFIITRTLNEVKIRFQNSEIYGVAAFTALTSHASIQFTIQNETGVFAIESVTFSQASSNPCEMVKVSILTTTQADSVLTPISIVPNSANPIEFERPRNTQFLFSATNEDGDSISQYINTPILLNSANFNIGILNGPNGSTVTISNTNTAFLQLQYNLDTNVTYQNSNIFTGLAPGTYKLYVRDAFGCLFSQDFTVGAYQEIYNAFFYISKSNSLRFAKRIIFGDSSNYKNDENTLSFEEDVKLPYRFIQQFNSADVVTTQFKSNYTTNTVSVVKEDASEVFVPLTQISQNIGAKDKRQAFMAASGTNTVVYFISGTIYDYDTNEEIQDYALNGTLPIWGKVGNYLSVDGGYYLIEDIYFDEVLNADVLVIDAVAPSEPTIKIVSCIFNIENYEVYEFTIDMVDYINENIRVRINSDHDSWDELIHLSEYINIQVNQPDTVEIKYWNSDNTDVFYSSNIRHKIRPEVTNVGGINEQDQENYKTDSNIKLINADVYEGDEFIFEPVTKEIMRKLLIALSHETIFINDVGYVKNDNIDVEGPLGESNLYVVKAKMLKNGNVYNSQSLGISSDIYNGSNEEIVGLITTESGFLKYQ
jgi:hypothetical protein